MFKNKFLLPFIVVVVLVIIGYTFFNTETRPIETTQSPYNSKILKERSEKNTFFEESEQSPIENKMDFKGLNYFVPDSSFRVLATILPYEKSDKKATITMSDGSVETYEKFGYASFQLQGQSLKLLVYKTEKTLSILFKDQTAPSETYGGGRYLDIPIESMDNSSIVIDFNLAYNPYCAYNHNYACPLPPKENFLGIRIEAGEKLLQ